MEEIILDAELRQDLGRSKVKDLRDKGFMPAVVYREGKVSQPIKVSSAGLIRLLHQHRLENAVVNLKIKDDKKSKSRACLIKEIQYHPVSGEIIHVDFYEVSLTQAIKVNVPVLAKGVASGVKQDGGSLETVLWEIEVECLPKDIPAEIEVDVTDLKIGDAIHIKDIKAPANVKILNSPDETVLHIVAPMKEEAAVEPVSGEEKKEPEVIKEKKEVAAEAPAEETKEKKNK